MDFSVSKKRLAVIIILSYICIKNIRQNNMKVCKICNKEKDDVEFSNGKFQTIKTCNECKRRIQRERRKNNLESQRLKDNAEYQKSKEHRLKYAKDYRKKYPERTRATNWKAKYGITPEEFYAKLAAQNNKCAICGRDMNDYTRIFCVDHNHTTNKVRGLLCDPCNYGLGFYEKHKDKYVAYLELYD